MKKYILMMKTMVASVSWEFQFTQPSDEMALEYARRIADSDPIPRAALSLLLFRYERDDQKLLAEFVWDKPTVRNILDDKKIRTLGPVLDPERPNN